VLRPQPAAIAEGRQPAGRADACSGEHHYLGSSGMSQMGHCRMDTTAIMPEDPTTRKFARRTKCSSFCASHRVFTTLLQSPKSASVGTREAGAA
jgi:hypothetical protein